ncbi:pyruvate formate lyase family protein, partial [Thermodesulfobacteriota bacterium]
MGADPGVEKAAGTGKQDGDRISRIRKRLQEEVPSISIERALYFTESWRETDGRNLPASLRVACAMNRVFERMSIYLDDDDRLAGSWTESFLGIPIDIERGLFNDVLAVELSRRALIMHQVKSGRRFLGYMLAIHGLSGLVRSVRNAKRAGTRPPVLGLATMELRERNRFHIDAGDRKILLHELLPYWRGKTVADRFARGLLSSGLVPAHVRDFIQALVSTPSKQTTIISPAAVIGTYQGHLIPDFEPVLARGLLAMRDEVIERIASSDAGDDETMSFLRSVKLALDGIILFAQRLAGVVADRAARTDDRTRRAGLEAMAAICAKVPLEPAESLDEAMQAYWTVKVATELANPQNVHSPGRLDQLFHPYYLK